MKVFFNTVSKSLLKDYVILNEIDSNLLVSPTRAMPTALYSRRRPAAATRTFPRCSSRSTWASGRPSARGRASGPPSALGPASGHRSAPGRASGLRSGKRCSRAGYDDSLLAISENELLGTTTTDPLIVRCSTYLQRTIKSLRCVASSQVPKPSHDGLGHSGDTPT